jgi:integrase
MQLPPTFDHVAHHYLKRDHTRSTRYIVSFWQKHFGNKQIKDIWYIDAMEKLEALQLAPASRTRYLATLRAVLFFGRDLGMGLPNRFIVSVGESAPIEHLSDIESTALIEAAAAACPHLHTFVLLCLYTGARPGEALALEWRNLDIQKALVIYSCRKGKSKRVRLRSVDLHPRLVASLVAEPRISHRVVNNAKGQPYDLSKDTHNLLDHDWQKIIRYAGIRPVTRYALRHTFATRLRWMGMELDELRQIMGHSTIAQTMVYAHIRPGRTQSIIHALE